MKTYLRLSMNKTGDLPPEFRSDDVRYTETLVKVFLEEYTKEGDLVLDPFMGFGTTLFAAEKLGRIAYGIEYEQSRCNYVRSLLKNPEQAINSDSTKLDSIDLPSFDFSITSPPYMGKTHKENPFTSYSTEFSGYPEYLQQIKEIYEQLKRKMKPHAHIVLEVANLKHEDGSFTTLAWDIANALSNVLTFKGEIIVAWDKPYGYGYDHSYCLVFTLS